MKPLPLIIIAILWPLLITAQNASNGKISGRVLDRNSQKPLTGATVALIQAEDSSRTPYVTYTDEAGCFSISNIKNGTYRVYFNYIGFTSVLTPQAIHVTGSTIELGNVLLTMKSLVLKEFEIIERRIPFTVKKDTIEFNANFYKTKDIDPMEILLRKLPGVEITSDGLIKFNGEIVKYILVDGKPFFVGDTRIATANLLSGIVDKVQIIDRQPETIQSDVPNFNKSERVLNITLKDSVYNKIGGYVSAGGGPKKRYAIGTNLNRFEKSKQISIISNGNNINRIGNTIVPNKGELSLLTTGINYNQDLSPELSLGIDYTVSKLTSNVVISSNRTNFMGDSSYTTNQLTNGENHLFMQGGNLNLNYKIDSFSSILLTNNLTVKSKEDILSSDYVTYALESIINKGSLVNKLITKNFYNQGTVNYTQHFRAPAKVLKLGMEYLVNNIEDNIYNTSTTNYYLSSGNYYTDSLNQYNKQANTNSEFRFDVAYSHPILKFSFLEIMYSYDRSAIKTNRSSFDYNNANGKFEIQIDSLTGKSYTYITSNYGSINFHLEKDRFDFSIGANLRNYQQRTGTSFQTQKYDESFWLFFPTIFIKLPLNKYSSINLDVSQDIQLPNTNQIFPLPNVGNPIFIQVGNAQLLPTRSNRANLSFSSYNSITQKSFSINANATTIKDQIINSIITDTLGRQVAIPINSQGGIVGSVSVLSSFPILSKKATFRTFSTFNINRANSSINSIIVKLDKYTLAQGIRIDYSKSDFLDLSFSSSVSTNNIKYLQSTLPGQNYIDYLIAVDGSINFPLHFDLKSDILYAINNGRGSGFNTSQLLWSIILSKTILKSNQAKISIQGFDILNQNKPIQRNVGLGYTEDVRINPISRFFLLSVTFYLK